MPISIVTVQLRGQLCFMGGTSSINQRFQSNYARIAAECQCCHSLRLAQRHPIFTMAESAVVYAIAAIWMMYSKCV